MTHFFYDKFPCFRKFFLTIGSRGIGKQFSYNYRKMNEEKEFVVSKFKNVEINTVIITFHHTGGVGMNFAYCLDGIYIYKEGIKLSSNCSPMWFKLEDIQGLPYNELISLIKQGQPHVFLNKLDENSPTLDEIIENSGFFKLLCKVEYEENHQTFFNEVIKEVMFNKYGFELTDENIISYLESKDRLYTLTHKYYQEFADYLSNYITGKSFPKKRDSQDDKDFFYRNMIEKAKEKGYMWIYDKYVDDTYDDKFYRVKFKITSLVEGRNYFGSVELNGVYEGILNHRSVKFFTDNHNGSFSDKLELSFFKYYNCQIVEYLGECSREDFGDG